MRVLLQDGRRVGAHDIAAFDRWLAQHRYLGTLEQLDQLLQQPPPPPPESRVARTNGSDPTGGSQRYLEEWRQEQSARAVAAAVRPWLERLSPLLGVAPGADHVQAADGDYADTVRALLDAGAEPKHDGYQAAHEGVRAVLAEHAAQ